jgi:hypothetical protein
LLQSAGKTTRHEREDQNINMLDRHLKSVENKYNKMWLKQSNRTLPVESTKGDLFAYEKEVR